ncbi:MAG: hypothetical protein ACYTG1_08855 [Planctomycetota bacterium]|jgi:hypothetical protein
MTSIRARLPLVLAAALLATAAAGGRPQDSDPLQLLDDFVHYALVAKPDLAAANARALVESGLSDADLAQLLDEGRVAPERYQRAIDRSIRVPELEATVAELARRMQSGHLDLMRDPDRIEQAVDMLTGHQRQRLIAQERLVAAGEYSVPRLLQEVTEGDDETLKLRCAEVLRRIGRLAVTPLTEALPNLGDQVSQRVVCDILGDIGWRHAGPALWALSLDESAAGPVREAARRAFANVEGTEAGLASLFADLGMRYFDGEESLVAYPLEPWNNVWAYDPFVGLVKTPVPTEIFNEVMAMRMASKGLVADPTHREALALFVASNLKRANDLPDDRTDPVYGDLRYSPEFYATVYGTDTALDVLAMAIDSLDTPLVRDAIAALSETTGGANLFRAGGDRSPLLEALEYPDRRVQYEAALALAWALPREGFAGDYRIVPLLASAVRAGSKSFALVLADDEEDRLQYVGDLERLGFEVVAFDADLNAVRDEIAQAIGVDLVVVRKRSPDAVVQLAADLRLPPKTAAAPVLVVAPGVDAPTLTREFRTDRRVRVVRPGAGADAFAAAVENVMERASGGRITEADAEAYAIDALLALRDVAVAGNVVYDVSDAESALLDALETRSGGARLMVADILSLIDSDVAQRRLFDAAFAAEEAEQIALLDRVAESVKRFGNRAEPRHVSALVTLVKDSTGATADAAARVHGALNLSSPEAVDLIP